MTAANHAIDRRARRTRHALQQALIALILKKGYDAITIKEICEHADVGRSTFYAHFAGKDDLKRSGLDHLRQALLASPHRAPSAAEGAPALGFGVRLFEHARDHRALYRALIGSRGGAVALETLRDILAERVRGELADRSGTAAAGDPPADITEQFLVGAYLAVLTWWLDGGTKLPPERVDAMVRRLASDGVWASRRSVDSAGDQPADHRR